jgi:hypothetical protein
MKIYQMFQAGAIAGLLCFFSLSCTGGMNRLVNSTSANANDSEPNLIYGDLILPENSEYLIIPVGFYQTDETISQKVLSSTDFSRSSESYREKQMTMHNMIFHHKPTGNSHLLLEKNALISSFNFLEVDSPKKTNKNQASLTESFMLLEIIPEDTNGDNKIDRQDAIVAYLADAAGKNVTQITPSKTTLLSYHLDKNLRFILL